MNFHIITIFPEMFDSYFNESILARAQKEEKIKINIYNLRDYADQDDKRRTVDDTPCGGGPGMVMMVEPIFKCVEEIKNKLKKHQRGEQSPAFRATRSERKIGLLAKPEESKQKLLILLTSAKGDLYNQQKAEQIKNNYTDVIIICGRYEGVDERVAQYISDEEVSIGQYVLTGGELPAMVIVDSVTRLIGGVLGNKESLESESYNAEKSKCMSTNSKEIKYDYPVYTRPTEFNDWEVPEVLLSGNHGAIKEWREGKKIK